VCVCVCVCFSPHELDSLDSRAEGSLFALVEFLTFLRCVCVCVIVTERKEMK